MKDKPTPEQLAKLPQWAQAHIHYLDRERKTAIDALNDHLDHQKPSPIYWDEYLSTGEGDQTSPTGPTNKRFYAQTRSVTIEHAGILLRVLCRSGERDTSGIDLQWSVPTGAIDMVALVPKSFQQVILVSHENMRVQRIRSTRP